MRRRSLLGAALAVAVGGCATPEERLRIMVPNPPGSGYDITARVLAGDSVEVFNLPGGNGLVGLRRLVYERGNDRLLMLMGLGLVGASAGAAVQLRDATPIARLVQEPAVLVVRRDSPYGSLDELIEDWRADPAGVRIGGGSSVGGPDHLATMLVAAAAGLSPSRVAYQRHDGGGDLLAAILGREVAFAMSGLSEYADQIASGQLRALAVTSEKPVPQVPAPTVRDAGLNVVFNNWRGLMAPPGLPAASVSSLRDFVASLTAAPAWTAAQGRFGWTGAYLAGAPFEAFLTAEGERVSGVLQRLGLQAS